MKLYYSPAACSLSPHIVVKELGLSVELVRVNLGNHKMEGDGDFYGVNPNGYVPALELDDGTRLFEGPAIVQFLADQKPGLGLAPKNGTVERAMLQQWLSFLTSEIHQGFHGVFYAKVAGKYGETSTAKLASRMAWIDQQLANRPFLLGDTFSVADAYLFALVGWANAPWITTYINSNFSVEGLDNLRGWYERVRARPAVQLALQEEGLS